MRALVSRTKACSSSKSLLTTATIGCKYAKNSAFRAGTSSEAKSGSGCGTDAREPVAAAWRKRETASRLPRRKRNNTRRSACRRRTRWAFACCAASGQVTDGACRPESPCDIWHGSCKSRATSRHAPTDQIDSSHGEHDVTIQLYPRETRHRYRGRRASTAPQPTPAPSASRVQPVRAAGSAARRSLSSTSSRNSSSARRRTRRSSTGGPPSSTC